MSTVTLTISLNPDQLLARLIEMEALVERQTSRSMLLTMSGMT